MTRFFVHIFHPAMARRFLTAVRQEGMRAALKKARVYAGMMWRGDGRSGFSGQPEGESPPAEAYLQGVWQQLALGNAFHATPPARDEAPFVAIIGDLNLPQCRKYRVEQLAAFWRAQGVGCDYAHFQDLPRVMRLLTRATRVVEYRLQSNPVTEMIRYEARRLRLQIMYDIDDPLFSVSAYETYGNMTALDPAMKAHFLGQAPKYLAMMNGADLISVSTPCLADHVRLFSARPVYVRRNFADAPTLDNGRIAIKSKSAGDDIFRVAFASGSQGHEVDFATILPTIETFLLASTKRRLMILGHFDVERLPRSLRARTDVVPFTTYDRYLAALAQADCAVMPLCADKFNDCKSAVRVIDAASVAVPSIVGSVGDLPVMVRDGETGYLARTPYDWIKILTHLEKDRSAARGMGRAARRDLEIRWSGTPEPHIIAPEILDWVRG